MPLHRYRMKSLKLANEKRVRIVVIAILGAALIPVVLFAAIYSLLLLGTIVAPTHKVTGIIPQYSFIDRKETIRGEPINLIIVGIDIEQEKPFEKIGWTPLQGFWKEGVGTAVTDLGKNITPISTRYLFGRVQDLAYQGAGSTVWQRHHVRLWKDRLPDGTPIYHVAASYDQTVGLAPPELLSRPTHLIAPDIDAERDAVGNALAQELNAHLSYSDNLLPVLYRSNGDNAWYYTDGMVSIITRTPADGHSSFGQAMKRGYFQLITGILKAFGVAK